MIHQLHFYLNDEKKIDDFIIQELRTTNTGISNLVRSLLYIYLKHRRQSTESGEIDTADFVKLVDARINDNKKER